jgi:hypothetical protein
MATKKKVTIPEIQVEISPPFKMDSTWSFRCNDERVTYEQYLATQKDHAEWVKEEAKPKEEYIPPKRKKK